MMNRKDVQKLYTEKGFAYRPTVQDLVEADFFDRVENKQLRRRIDKIIRAKVGEKEYIVYDETLLALDKLGNILSLNRMQGRYEDPQFTYEWDKSVNKEVAKSLVGKKMVYEIPYSKEEMQKILNSNTEEDATTSFVLIAGANAKYAGFTTDEFVNRTFEELYTKATTGEFPEETTTTTTPKPSKERATQLYVKEIKKGLIAETEAGSEEEKEYDKISDRMSESAQKAWREADEPPPPTTEEEKSIGSKKRPIKKASRRKM